MFKCGTCGKGFPAGWQARDNHCRSTGHRPPRFECDTCDAWFGSEQARRQHMSAKSHWHEKEYECTLCYNRYNDEEDCKDHEVQDHYYCRDCDRTFNNYNCIKMHLNSRIHRGEEIKCPFCGKFYVTATGMVHHLETGSCEKAISLTRDEVYRFVRAKDPQGIITKKLIGWSGDSATYTVTNKAWNGRAWECYFCRRGFGSPGALHNHINSNTHRQPLYHCFNPRCRMDFKSLAAVINHLESETCGAMRFETLQRSIGDFVTSSNLLLGV